ncbi:MAG: hypothetical protein UFG06_13540 [Lachnospiraceae bacterium]|nr:hypothetical protein [Lachnospiraceae bacterium]
MFCGNCGKEIPDKGLFCPYCGCQVGGNVAAESAKVVTFNTLQGDAIQQKNDKQQKSDKKLKADNKQKTQNKSVKVLNILIVAVFVAIVGIVGIFAGRWYWSAEQKINRALEKEDFEAAYDIFMKSDSVNSDCLEEALLEKIEVLKTQFLNEEIDYVTADAELLSIESMNLPGIQRTALEARTFLTEMNQSKTAFRTAESLVTEGRYEEALGQYRNVLRNDIHFEEAQAGLISVSEKYRSVILEQVGADRAEGKYNDALLKLYEALRVLPDDAAFMEQVVILEADSREQRKQSVLTEAESKADTGNWADAIKVLGHASGEFGNDADFSSAMTSYTNAYVEQVQQQTEELLKQKKYEEAEDIIYEALRVLPNNQILNEMITDIENRKPVNIADMAEFAFGFPWNEGVPKDPFGNDYSGAANYACLINYDLFDDDIYYAEYRLYGDYSTVTGNIVAEQDCYLYSDIHVKIYSDDTLIYTSPSVNRKTDNFTFEVSVKNTDYLRIEADISGGGGIILSDVFINKE